MLFSLAPPVQSAVAVIGAATLLIAGSSALSQRDIKRVLAYSTISQIGYMFLALGVGAWSAAIFHLMTHAFFKALLFLAAGVVIMAMHEEHDMFKMGGLRGRLPLTFWTFLVGAASLSALPLVTAGFYSKDLILWSAWSSPTGSTWLWIAGLVGALLTSLYTFRMVFLTFFGEAKHEVNYTPGNRINLPLIVLASLSLIGGIVELPHTLGGQPLFSEFMGSVLPALPDVQGYTTRRVGITDCCCRRIALRDLSGLSILSSTRYGEVSRGPRWARHWIAFGLGVGDLTGSIDKLFVIPYSWLARTNKDDFIDSIYDGIAKLNEVFYRALSQTETGKVRWYMTGIALGAIVAIAIVVFL